MLIPFRDNVPTRTTPIITYLLLGTNVAVFLFQIFLPPEVYVRVVHHYGAIPAEISNPGNWLAAGSDNAALSIITSMFMHGGLAHLGGNMLYLWIFGNNVEDCMGHLRFVVFYLLCGFIAAWIQTLGAPGSTAPMIGASGAVAGVLGAYLILHPFARVQTVVFLLFLFPIIELPAIFVLTVWFLLQITSSLAAPTEAEGVAWHAHIGGFTAGFLLVRYFQKRKARRDYTGFR